VGHPYLNMEKRLVIGIGTGRCGTRSLSNVLGSQPDSSFTHEARPLLPWRFSEEAISKKLADLHNYEGVFIGDVASYYLPYVEYILSRDPSAKFICLKRAKQEVITSFLRRSIDKNLWMAHDGKRWKKNDNDQCFPHYEASSKREAIGLYWEEYTKEAERLSAKYPDNIRVWEMDQLLNSEKGLREALSFIGIPETSQVLLTGMKSNHLNLNFVLCHSIRGVVRRLLDTLKRRFIK